MPMRTLFTRSRLKLSLTLAAMTLLPAFAGQAAMTAWAENEGGRMRIIALPPEPDGTLRGALQIEPKAGWITYWKQPGEAGIQPQLTLSPGLGITLDALDFPVPKAFEEGGVRDMGYDHPVALPFRMSIKDKSRPVAVNASVFIGLCRNICIPFQADFALDLTGQTALPLQENLILDRALKSVPEAPSPGFSVARHGLSDDGRLLELALKLPKAESAPVIYAVGPGGLVLLDQVNGRHAEDGLYHVGMPLPKPSPTFDPKTARFDLLVMAGGRAMETSLAFD
ncbi:protein-disulfide reductase DsbD domain-containing protein [Rhizobium sp. SSA_523]|uniref:protein-disulfide reductase DsbD domain-containing protein n=1 Tax=Rhizobium sp. SSA_523 TaxID=2952477 RepID=UPI002091E2DB|nr:protein-disulfide reductase DsbD domain-containing protein [Rhizobium sp. SSA_523]MCO5731035.1 cytochrome C biogenesis protein [Rhizobium sp. SSA_523]WKC24162.1 protein-disulfide reductase DsbD family protein [Rhizobium sp. SSA_523]